jgi:hypothetical protein
MGDAVGTATASVSGGFDFQLKVGKLFLDAGIFRGELIHIYTAQVRRCGLLKPAKAGFVYVEAVSNRPFCEDAGIFRGE